MSGDFSPPRPQLAWIENEKKALGAVLSNIAHDQFAWSGKLVLLHDLVQEHAPRCGIEEEERQKYGWLTDIARLYALLLNSSIPMNTSHFSLINVDATYLDPRFKQNGVLIVSHVLDFRPRIEMRGPSGLLRQCHYCGQTVDRDANPDMVLKSTKWGTFVHSECHPSFLRLPGDAVAPAAA